MHRDIDDLSLEHIMRRWPQTIQLFVAWRIHCVGCPIADFHTLADSAEEHGYPFEELRRAVLLTIDEGAISTAYQPTRRRPSEACGGP